MQETEIEASCFLGRSLVRERTQQLLGEMGKHTGARQQHIVWPVGI